MYAGGGFLGGSDALQLTNLNGDSIWEGVATVFRIMDQIIMLFSIAQMGIVIGK